MKTAHLTGIVFLAFASSVLGNDYSSEFSTNAPTQLQGRVATLLDGLLKKLVTPTQPSFSQGIGPYDNNDELQAIIFRIAEEGTTLAQNSEIVKVISNEEKRVIAVNPASISYLVAAKALCGDPAALREVPFFLSGDSPALRNLGCYAAGRYGLTNTIEELETLASTDSCVRLERDEKNQLVFVAPIRRSAMIALSEMGHTYKGSYVVDCSEGLKGLEDLYVANEGLRKQIEDLLGTALKSFSKGKFKKCLLTFAKEPATADRATFRKMCEDIALAHGGTVEESAPPWPKDSTSRRDLPPPPMAPK